MTDLLISLLLCLPDEALEALTRRVAAILAANRHEAKS